MLATDVRYFIETVKNGGIGRTAELLGLSQPALTKAVGRLEKTVGTLLLRRTPRGTELTDAGRAFYEHACIAAFNLEDGLQIARDTGNGNAGLLRMGMTPATSHFVLAALFPRLRKERPASTLQLRTAFADELFEALLQQNLSIAVGPVPHQIPEGLVCDVLYEEGFFLVHNTSHPLAKKRNISAEDLEACEFAGPGIHEVARHAVETALRDLGLRVPRVVVQTNSFESILHAVATSPLVTMISSTMSNGGLPPNLIVRPLPLANIQRRIGVFRGKAHLSAIGERAIDLLKMHAGELRSAGVLGEGDNSSTHFELPRKTRRQIT